MLLGDQERTLTLIAKQQLEAEANFAAGRLRFLRDEFSERLKCAELTYSSIQSLAKEFGNAMTTTLWRTVESLDEPAFRLVTQHPAQPVDSGKPIVRYFVRSQQFAEQFPRVTQQYLFGQLGTVCRRGNGPIGAVDVVLRNANGDEHIFHMEAFHNRHSTLTLGTHQQARRLALAV